MDKSFLADAGVTLKYTDGILRVDSTSASLSVYNLSGTTLFNVNATAADMTAYKNSMVIVKATTPAGVSVAKLRL